MADLQKPNCSNIVIAATFTTDPLSPVLQFLLREAELPLEVELSPYNQIFQELLSSTSQLATNADGVGVILVRVEDFVRDTWNIDNAACAINRTVLELEKALTHHSQRSKSPTIFAVLAATPRAPKELLSEIEAANATLVECARSLPGVIAISHDNPQFLLSDCYDRVGDELAHIPYKDEGYASMAIAIARKVHTLRVPPHKVLALDCDGTLWRGIVGEDGADGIKISKAHARIQQFAVELQKQGTLVCIVSKNTERDVLEVFDKRSDMILKLEHIAAYRINWKSKPQNLASLASALNLGLDSFVFLDDSPLECALVRAELPQVVTLQIPEETQIESFLSNLWNFDKLTITDEDARRTSMYREDATRQKLRESTVDLGEFIASLRVEIDIDQPTEEEWARLAQLTLRTNQFNFTTIRRTELEIRALGRDRANVLAVKVRDRFGDYGLVGLVILEDMLGTLSVDTLLLSCRALGRGVEHAILRRLGEIARGRGHLGIDLRYKPTSRNEPARAFAESVAARFRVEEQGQIIYRIPVDDACAVVLQTDRDSAQTIKPGESENRRNATTSGSQPQVHRSERYERLARTLVSPPRILDAVRRGRVRLSHRKPIAPATDIERRMLGLWQELLAVDGVGVEDNYFELGGTSLMAVRLAAEVSRRFGVKLPLTTILESPTIRSFSLRLNEQRNPNSEILIELSHGCPRNFFVVHDGDGETLLYLNLARRMRSNLAVFGIEPRRTNGVPMAHGSIEDMAASYVDEIRKKQPCGPYFLGGMCAGGVIAYEMASQLVRTGENIALLTLLDAAAPHASKRAWRTSKDRLGRLNKALASAQKNELSSLNLVGLMVRTICLKSANALLWEVYHRGKQCSVRARHRLLREVLSRDREWPDFVPKLTVRESYDAAEALYRPKPLSIPSIVLIRARSGEGIDTPYKEVYADETLGWRALAPDITVLDVDGGHSTMLQEQFVDSLANALTPFLYHNLERIVESSLRTATA
jgi:FkbH-like protein